MSFKFSTGKFIFILSLNEDALTNWLTLLFNIGLGIIAQLDFSKFDK